jgi:HPt (histidine-containing phosphotransfer) domain-containing protein
MQPAEMRELLGLLAESVESEIDAISRAIRDSDTATVTEHAHALRGTALNYGATQLATAANELELAVGSDSDLASAVDAIQAAWPLTMAAIRDLPAQLYTAEPQGI